MKPDLVTERFQGRNGAMESLIYRSQSKPRWWERLRDWWNGVDRRTSATVEEEVKWG